jgi:probable rRNA maturation factor
MPRTRTAEPAPRILVSGASAPLSPSAVRRAAGRVLARERRRATLSITFIGRDRMRALNRRWKGRSAPTDVLAFPLRSPAGALAGDIYICPWQAARHARALRVPVRQELTRLVVHGVLHVLGYDHPETGDRTRSAMWRRQERYVRGLS